MRVSTRSLALKALPLLAALPIAAGILLSMLSPVPVKWRFVRPEPSEALEVFYGYGRDDDRVSEAMLMDPLIIAGDDVVPLVLAAIRDAKMPRRAYAISFFGNGRYREALPQLREIASDLVEAETIRMAALLAAVEISQDESSLCQELVETEGRIAILAKRVLAGREPKRSQRTYWEAMRSADP